MAEIGFIGLGNMGGPMVRNLIGAGHAVVAYDLVAEKRQAAAADGAVVAESAAEAARAGEIVITMLPEGAHVRVVYTGADGILGAASAGVQLIDCSTIDVDTARAVNGAATAAGFDLLDAPVSGGVGGAEAGTLTFMVGGSEAGFGRARAILEDMGKTIVHAGPTGSGQAAKICNNMILAISMIGVSEAFALAHGLGLDAQKLFDIVATASGQCWALTTYCPEPGPVPSSPANRDYAPGFTAAMMLKDLRLAQQAVTSAGTASPLGAGAAALYALYCNAGNEARDFSGIIRMIKGA